MTAALSVLKVPVALLAEPSVIVTLSSIIHRVSKLVLHYFPFLRSTGIIGFGATDLLVKGMNRKLSVAGIVYIASGVLSSFASLHKIQVISLGVFCGVAANAGAALFILGNILSLHQNMKEYIRAEREVDDPSRQKAIKTSCIFGIISSIGYIVLTVCTFFASPLALLILLSCISLLSGLIQIIFNISKNI